MPLILEQDILFSLSLIFHTLDTVETLAFDLFSSEVDPEFQRLKEEHLVKMASLRQETELLKQQAEVEKMRKQLKELRGESIIPLEGNRKVCTCSFQVNSLGSQQLYCLRILQDVRIARVSLTNFARVAVN